MYSPCDDELMSASYYPPTAKQTRLPDGILMTCSADILPGIQEWKSVLGSWSCTRGLTHVTCRCISYTLNKRSCCVQLIVCVRLARRLFGAALTSQTRTDALSDGKEQHRYDEHIVLVSLSQWGADYGHMARLLLMSDVLNLSSLSVSLWNWNCLNICRTSDLVW